MGNDASVVVRNAWRAQYGSQLLRKCGQRYWVDSREINWELGQDRFKWWMYFSWNWSQFLVVGLITWGNDIALLQALGDSTEVPQSSVQPLTQPSYQQQPIHKSALPPNQPTPPVPSRELVQSDISRTAGRDFLGAGGRDFFSNMSSEWNGIAAQTSSVLSGIFGKRDLGMFWPLYKELCQCRVVPSCLAVVYVESNGVPTIMVEWLACGFPESL